MKARGHLVAEAVRLSPDDETLTHSATRGAPQLVVISPEHDEPREAALLGELLAAGLERYHVRKPDWPREKLATWLAALPNEWRARIVVHQHHELPETLGLGAVPGFTSRSCHDLPTLRATLGLYDSVFFSPVFPSISKPGHVPRADISFTELASLLANRTAAERRTTVLALGGITTETAPRALALGFDGVAVLGAIWQAADPLRAFRDLLAVAPASRRSNSTDAGWKPALLPTHA